VYEGDYANNSANGKGKETDANGNVYEGDFYGEPQGKGKMTYANGKIEEGEWKDGKFMSNEQ